MKLTDLYTEADLNDKDELLYHRVDDEDLDIDLTVKTMDHAFVATLLASDGHSRIVDVYANHADADQRALVQDKIDNFDESRVIVVFDRELVDGFHHAIAAWTAGRDVLCIDLAEACTPDDMRPA